MLLVLMQHGAVTAAITGTDRPGAGRISYEARCLRSWAAGCIALMRVRTCAAECQGCHGPAQVPQVSLLLQGEIWNMGSCRATLGARNLHRGR